MDPAVFLLFEQAAPAIVVWLMGFVVLTLATLGKRAWLGQTDTYRESLIGGELPGILLVLMHSVCFGYAVWRLDWVSALLFGWWGPGFLIVAVLVLTKYPVNWKKVALFTSVGCKLNYAALVACFIIHDALLPVYAYSLWIMHDQVRLTWLQHNADRTRRLFEDRWLVRICYPGFLVLPAFMDDFALRIPCLIAGGRGGRAVDSWRAAGDAGGRVHAQAAQLHRQPARHHLPARGRRLRPEVCQSDALTHRTAGMLRVIHSRSLSQRENLSRRGDFHALAASSSRGRAPCR